MIAIIDYGAGNLFSVKNALDYLQIENQITANPAELAAADGMILPGVGAFRDAMTMLNQSGFTEAIKQQVKAGKPLLGICLGMQMLFEKGYEFGETDGLGLIPGCVQRIDSGGLKIPHMGWNDLTVLHDCALSADIQDGDYVYFVHSYRQKPAMIILAAMPPIMKKFRDWYFVITFTARSFIRKKAVRWAWEF